SDIKPVESYMIPVDSGDEEADEGEGGGSEEEYDEGNDDYMTQMQGGVTDS
ncbi:hypothetical protein Tco_1469998, partial [Tanacetum coccineum]